MILLSLGLERGLTKLNIGGGYVVEVLGGQPAAGCRLQLTTVISAIRMT